MSKFVALDRYIIKDIFHDESTTHIFIYLFSNIDIFNKND